ncbi:hypothetical protein [Pantoea septica]|uniref:hypothetical protein n=1 Tax=Pantoea septica TaxID=472695 RepID=UPI0028AEBDA4|nr:hypothetical protein [Pantoea septica]
MKTWLASFQVERGGECFDAHLLLRAESEIMAEAGCGYMGQAWWPAAPKVWDLSGERWKDFR